MNHDKIKKQIFELMPEIERNMYITGNCFLSYKNDILEIVDVEDVEIKNTHEQFIKDLKEHGRKIASDPGLAKKALVEAGIVNEKGELNEPYICEED